jgi:hypothetical protein
LYRKAIVSQSDSIAKRLYRKAIAERLQSGCDCRAIEERFYRKAIAEQLQSDRSICAFSKSRIVKAGPVEADSQLYRTTKAAGNSHAQVDIN